MGEKPQGFDDFTSPDFRLSRQGENDLPVAAPNRPLCLSRLARQGADESSVLTLPIRPLRPFARRQALLEPKKGGSPSRQFARTRSGTFGDEFDL